MFIKIYLKQKIKKKQAIAVPFTIFVNWKSLFTITLYNEKKKKRNNRFSEKNDTLKNHTFILQKINVIFNVTNLRTNTSHTSKSLFQRNKTWSVIKCNKIERREGKWDKAREDIQIYPKWEIREDNINTVVRGKHAYVKWFLVSSFVQSLSFRLLTHEPSHVPTPSPQPIIPRSTILPSIHSRFQKIHFTTLMNNLVISNSSINNSL